MAEVREQVHEQVRERVRERVRDRVRVQERNRDGGMASAELAVAMPALLVVLVLALGAIRLGIDEVRCVDAARLAARALARGDPEEAARGFAARAGPPGAVITVRRGGSEISVEVSTTREVGGWRQLTVRGTAAAQRERAAADG